MISGHTVSPTYYNELMGTYKDYCDAFDSLYKLKTKDEKELTVIYQDIKILIDSYKYPPNTILMDISRISKFNNRYMKSYLYIVKQIFEEYQPKEIKHINPVFDYILYKEYGIVLEESNRSKFEECESKNYSSDIHKENTIYRAIMDDDKVLLIFIIEKSEFDENQKLQSPFYPPSRTPYSYLDLCCYYGSVGCFKLFITKFHSKITKDCLYLSFLGGNQEIMSECLKVEKPDEKCMIYAIISHNIDFVSFLMNEYKININLGCCCVQNNLRAFLVHLDQTNDIDSCFAFSPYFILPSLVEYFILHGADVNAKDKQNKTLLHKVACINSKETAEILISHGANVNAKDEDNKTPLHKAALNNSKETTEILISHGADINAKAKYNETPLHTAAYYNIKETAEILISHGADINAKAKYNETPLHKAAYNNHKEIVEILILHGADINARDEIGQTPLRKAANNGSKETVEILISHGAEVNTKDKSKTTHFMEQHITTTKK
ncbi:hypothetical protein TVAG_415390 [Trichomonas vaginalis G3]|uniref:DUF3447 domain-containing protein n=1 Tax=Trichomonas vaginalis (strain ATCC PRA-98 / G3) TaxID=412133 RepID=A2EW69_TRIV3|nr:ankyrin repeat and SOCS box-containing protein 4 family [Trichomonas vaginalis G3]EAY03105.1 hypothetical protein TVAG_415390 [Trichomonas vaginalis G3]KAI5513706.1 ankyrin repeat and SOCS box-containing protein 4 family [Trichomonas vaginalis G3]|eukprot:XP_001315328.1 hypothetical protein [Trichomonas vaginalis G3]